MYWVRYVICGSAALGFQKLTFAVWKLDELLLTTEQFDSTFQNCWMEEIGSFVHGWLLPTLLILGTLG